MGTHADLPRRGVIGARRGLRLASVGAARAPAAGRGQLSPVFVHPGGDTFVLESDSWLISRTR